LRSKILMSEVSDIKNPYTTRTIGKFLGWAETKNNRVPEKLNYLVWALELIEEGLVGESEFDYLTSWQAETVIEQARRIRNEYKSSAKIHRQNATEAGRAAEKAKTEEERQQYERAEKSSAVKAAEFLIEGDDVAAKVAHVVSTSLRDGTIGCKEAAKVARRVTGAKPKKKSQPDIEVFADRLIIKLGKILHPEFDPLGKKLENVLGFTDDLFDATRDNLHKVLHGIANRALDYSKQIPTGQEPRQLIGDE